MSFPAGPPPCLCSRFHFHVLPLQPRIIIVWLQQPDSLPEVDQFLEICECRADTQTTGLGTHQPESSFPSGIAFANCMCQPSVNKLVLGHVLLLLQDPYISVSKCVERGAQQKNKRGIVTYLFNILWECFEVSLERIL